MNENIPKAIGPYSIAYKAGDLLFCSGQIPINPKTMELIDGGIDKQTIQVCRNIGEILRKYGISMKDIVKTTVFLKNLSDIEEVNNIYKDYFIMKPARSVVEVSNLPNGALIEIEAIAKVN